jgi:hypothetical protein
MICTLEECEEDFRRGAGSGGSSILLCPSQNCCTPAQQDDQSPSVRNWIAPSALQTRATSAVNPEGRSPASTCVLESAWHDLDALPRIFEERPLLLILHLVASSF